MIDTYTEIYQKKELPWGRTQFYQSSPDLNLMGERDTEKRFGQYKLRYLLDKKSRVLDIGSNCGFLDLFISKYVQTIDGIEIEKHLCELSNLAKDNLNVNNCFFYNTDFKYFRPTKQYNVVFSLAEHLWINLPFDLYIDKIKSLLEVKGLFFIESHKISLGLDNDFEDKLKIIENKGFTKIYQCHIDYGRDERILAIFRLGKFEKREIQEILEINNVFDYQRLDINLTCLAIEELLNTGNSELYKEYHFKRHGWINCEKNFPDLLRYIEVAKENSLFLEPIQLDSKDTLFDGCHRFSAIIYNNQKYILTEKLDFISNIVINEKELLKIKLSSELINKLKNNCRRTYGT